MPKENFSLKMSLLVLLLFFNSAPTTLAEEEDNGPVNRKILFQRSFTRESDLTGVRAWTNVPGKQPQLALADLPDGPALVSRGGKVGYNTPIFKTNVRITRRTVLEFSVKATIGGLCELNLTDGEENARYNLFFPLKANTWTVFRRLVDTADFKNNFGNSHRNDGLAGDRLTSLQICTRGPEVLVRNLCLYDTPEEFTVLPRELPLTDEPYQPRRYPRFGRNGFFAFGAITTVSAANFRNGKLFGQDGYERFEYDLRDLRRHNLNLISNFCDSWKRLPRRLELMDYYSLNLMDTALAGTEVTTLAEKNRPLFDSVKSCAEHPRLAAWYAQDEPSEFKKYLDNKLQLSELTPGIPVSSAFCSAKAVRRLGPYMELVMPDVYLLTPAISRDSAAHQFVSASTSRIQLAREKSRGGKVWYITQAFSNRMRRDSSLNLRYPEAVEMRFDVYNALAAGAEGIIFFIHCDYVPYLDGVRRHEEFDRTLSDAWYNDNPTYAEIARLGFGLVPLMPSLFEAKDIEPYAYDVRRRLVSRSFTNELGRYRWLVNANLSLPAKVAPGLKSGPGEHLYELLSGQEEIEVGKPLTLSPGGGALVMAATPENFARLRGESNSRRLARERANADIGLKLLARAGFAVEPLQVDLQNIPESIAPNDASAQAESEDSLRKLSAAVQVLTAANPAYTEMKADLERSRALFGRLNRHLVKPEVIFKIDPTEDAAWRSWLNRFKELSCEYFSLLRECDRGDFARRAEAAALPTSLGTLAKTMPRLPR